MNKKSRKATKDGSGALRDSKSRRKVVVFSSLTGALGLTCALMVLLATNPLPPEAAISLVAIQTSEDAARLFKTKVPFEDNRWHFIYIHQSNTREGNAASMAQGREGMGDHFLIGNGNGCGDGVVQASQRWMQQQPARPLGAKITDDCISICLVGDFDRDLPTELQLEQLGQLVRALQRECKLSARKVVVSPAIGRQFAQNSFRQGLNP